MRHFASLQDKTDRKGNEIVYWYDFQNHLTRKVLPDNSQVNYTYDDAGRLAQVTDPSGTYGFQYDNMGRLVGTTTNYSFVTTRTFTTSYGYDAA